MKPALKINVTSVPDCFADVIARFKGWISSNSTSETDRANLRVAAGVMEGRLQGHPLLHGLSLQCMRMVEKQDRGVNTMRGRRCNETELETQLISDAGLALASASGLNSLVKMSLGIGWNWIKFEGLRRNFVGFEWF